MAREGGGRFEFGWFGIFGMFFVFTAGSVVIFFLGIYVGKGLQESRLAREERVVRLPVTQGEGSAESARESEQPRSSEQVAQVAPGQPQPAATANVNLAVRSAVEPVATANPAMAATMAPQVAATPPRLIAAAALPTAASVPVVRSTPAADALAKLDLPHATAKMSAKGWSVQVNATKDEATADRLVARLTELGYQSFIVRVRLADETWYRVRVGRFPTMEAATAVVMRLKNEERYSRAFLVNE